MTPARRLRERLATGEVLLIGGAYNALVARIYERAGFEALYTGGYAAAAANFALPDIGLMTQTEMCGHVERISKSVSLPLVSDADTGFGELTNVARTVREYERAGAAAIQLEDQTFPKRCGHMEGKKVIPRDEMVRKVRAALAARANPDTVIIARTDAIAVNGVDDAIDRLSAYAEAGADVLFPDAPRSLEEMHAIASAVGERPSSRTTRSTARRRSSRPSRRRRRASASASTRPRRCSPPRSRRSRSRPRCSAITRAARCSTA